MATYTPLPPQEALIRQEIARIQQGLASLGAEPDAQEMAERVAATDAYAGESPMHFVNYVEECVSTTATALREVRAMQRQCYEVYQEKEPPNYAAKLEWQSRAILPKPYAAVQFAVAMVQAAFSPQFLSIKGEPADTMNLFWTKLLTRQLDEQHANFVTRFTDATEMGFAVGQSMEMIPIWDNERRALTYSLVEPWKIDRDPNALNREPQSGLYWIHSEWMDYHVLRQGEAQGRYKHTSGLNSETGASRVSQNQLMQESEQARIRNYVHKRNMYRSAVLTREFWGTVLSPTGEVLLPHATFTIAGKRLIADPAPSPYSTLRWPGIGFSPLPHLLRFEGRSLLQSVTSLWHLMCNLLSLHADYQNWIVNPMREINTRGLVDKDDIDAYPGKVYQTVDTVSGQQVVRTVDQRFISGDILATEQYYDQTFQRGTMVTDVVQGLPGYRAEITARESAQHLAQSRSAFTKMGSNLDLGAVQAILAGMETLRLDITRQALLDTFTMPELVEMFGDRGDKQPTIFDDAVPTGVKLPPLIGGVHVSGLQTLLQETEELGLIERLIVPMATHPVFAPYVKNYNLVKAIEARANLEDEGLLVDDKEAQALMQSQAEQAKQQTEMQTALMQMQLQTLQKKIELDERKVALLEQAQALKADEAHLASMQAALELEQQQGENAAAQATMRAEIATKAAQIAQTMQQMALDQEKLALEEDRTEGQLVKIAAAIAAQQEKLRLAHAQLQVDRERIAADIERAQIQATAFQRRAD